MKTGKSWDLEVCTSLKEEPGGLQAKWSLRVRHDWAGRNILTEHQAQKETRESSQAGIVQYTERGQALQLVHSIEMLPTQDMMVLRIEALTALRSHLGHLQALFSTLTPGLSWWSIALITSLSFLKNTFSPIPRPTILISNATICLTLRFY